MALASAYPRCCRGGDPAHPRTRLLTPRPPARAAPPRPGAAAIRMAAAPAAVSGSATCAREAKCTGASARSSDAAARGASEIGLRAAAGEMQDAVERALAPAPPPPAARKALGLDRAIDHRGVHDAGRRRRDLAGAVLAGEIKQRQPRAAQAARAGDRARSALSPSAECTSRKPAARAASAVRRPTVKPASAMSRASARDARRRRAPHWRW